MESHHPLPNGFDSSDPDDEFSVMLSTFDQHYDASQFFSHNSYLASSSCAQPQQCPDSTFIPTPASLPMQPTSCEFSPGFTIAPTSPHHHPTPPLSHGSSSYTAASDHVEPLDMDFQAPLALHKHPLHQDFSSEGTDVHGRQGSTSWAEPGEAAQTSGKAKEKDKEDASQAGNKIRTNGQLQLAMGRKKSEKKAKKARGPKVAIRTESEVDVMDDGYKWRKYGQKPLKNNPFSRNYYRCSYRQCLVKKQVERDANSPSYVVTTYEGAHNHLASPTPMPVAQRTTFVMPEAFNFALPLEMGLFQMPENQPKQILLQEHSEIRRDQGLLEDVLPTELRRRSI